MTYFRKRLMRELKDLAVGADCNFDGLHNVKEESADLIDKAASLIDRSLSQNICDRKNIRIREIEQALEDLAAGLYGICERCGEDISINRLKVSPVARQCIGCKTETETRERLTASHQS